MPASSSSIGVTDEQVWQKEREPPDSVLKLDMASWPLIQRKPASGALTNVAYGAP
jgi:hypothetical protein